MDRKKSLVTIAALLLGCSDDNNPPLNQAPTGGSSAEGGGSASTGGGDSEGGGASGASGGSSQGGNGTAGNGAGGPIACGNGQLEAYETCDDGNTSGSDGCSATCDLEPGTVCGDAVDLNSSGNITTSGTSTYYVGTTEASVLTHDFVPSCSNGTVDQPIVLHRYVTQAEGPISIESYSTDGSNNDTVLWAYLDCQDVASELGCNDDKSAEEKTSRIETETLSAGTAVFIAVAGFGDQDTGGYGLRISEYAEATSIGTCDTPEAITEGHFVGETPSQGSTITGTCVGAASESVFTVELSESADLRVTVVPRANQDIGVYVRSSLCALNSEQDCANEGSAGEPETLVFENLFPGTYVIVVDGATASDVGGFLLDVEKVSILSEGTSCVPNLATTRCADGNLCLGDTTTGACTDAFAEQTFDASLSPFSASDAGADSNTWEYCDGTLCGANQTGSPSLGGYAVVLDPENVDLNGEMLVSPMYTAATLTRVWLEWYQAYLDNSEATEEGRVEFSSDSINWTPVAVFSDADSIGRNVVDLSSLAAGEAVFYVRFVYDDQVSGGDDWAYEWQIDDVRVYGY